MSEIQKAIEQYIKKYGLEMRKPLSEGGLFSDATYDTRRAYSFKDLYKLNSEGFLISQDLGNFLFNASMQYKPPTQEKESR